MSPVNSANAPVTPVRSVERQILATTNTGDSGWQDVSGLTPLSVFVLGLETGSTVKVEVANGAAAPTNGAILDAALAPDANGCVVYAPVGPFHWLRVTKTRGATPTASVGTLHAQFV